MKRIAAIAFFSVLSVSVTFAFTGEDEKKNKDKKAATTEIKLVGEDAENKASLKKESKSDSSYSAMNRFNYLFSFIYRYKYAEQAEWLKSLLGDD